MAGPSNGVEPIVCTHGVAELLEQNQHCNFCAAENSRPATTTIDLIMCKREELHRKVRTSTVRLKLAACEPCRRRESLYVYIVSITGIGAVGSYLAFMILKAYGNNWAEVAVGVAIAFTAAAGLLTAARCFLKSFFGVKGWSHMKVHPTVAYWAEKGYSVGASPWTTEAKRGG